MKKILSVLLVLTLAIAISAPAFAIDSTGFVKDKAGNCTSTLNYTWNGQQKTVTGTGTWYLVPDGTRSFMIETAECYVWFKGVSATIDGVRYTFDSNGRTAQKPSASTSATPNGFSVAGDYTYYIVNNQKATGSRTIDGSTYYFSKGDDGRPEGAMIKDTWQKQGESWYRYGADGKLIKNQLIKIGDDTFKVDSLGRRQTGIVTIDGEKYFFAYGNDGHPEGAMATNSIRKIDGSTYSFGTDGKAAKNVWVSVNGAWRYAGSDCRLS